MFLCGLLHILVKVFTLLRRKKSCHLRGIYWHNYSHHLEKLSEKTPKINNTAYAAICQRPELTENSLMETFLLYFQKRQTCCREPRCYTDVFFSLSHCGFPTIFVSYLLLLFFLDFIYLLLERGEGREKQRDRNIDWLSLIHTPTRDETQAYFLTVNWTSNTLFCRRMSSLLSLSGQLCVLSSNFSLLHPSFIKTFTTKGYSLPELSRHY